MPSQMLNATWSPTLESVSWITRMLALVWATTDPTKSTSWALFTERPYLFGP